MWFLGENDLGIPVYDFETAGCFDGLERHGLNKNQGAESTLAYLIAHLTVLLAHEKGMMKNISTTKVTKAQRDKVRRN